MWVNKTITKTVTNAAQTDTDSFVTQIVSELAALDGITAVSGENAVLIANKLKLSFSSTSTTTVTVGASVGTFDGGSQSVNVITGTSGSRTYLLNFHLAASKDGKVVSVKIKNCATAAAASLNFNDDILWLKSDNDTELFSRTHVNNTSASTTRNFATSQALQRVSDGQAVYTVQNRTPYVNNSDSTRLDTISGKVLTEGGIRVDCIGSMLDSSYIAGDALYPSGSDQYYAVDDYSLILV